MLLIDPTNPDALIAAGVSGGVWKTADAGASWRPVGQDLANIGVNAMAISPTNAKVLVAGTGEGYFREVVRGTGLPLRGGGVFKSVDGGETWQFVASTNGSDFYWVNDLVFSPASDRRLYAATRTGVHRSLDAGETWTTILPTTVNGGCLDLAIRADQSADVLFASCGTYEQATVYRTLDAGGAAVFLETLKDEGMGRTSLAIAPSDQNVIYALAASNLPGPRGLYEQGLHAVFRSTQAGAPGTWEARVRNNDPVKLNTLLLTNPVAASYVDCRMAASDSYTPMGWYVNVIAVDPVDPTIVWAAGVDWFRSSDAGRTWGLVSQWWDSSPASYVHADQHAIAFDPRYNGAGNQIIYVAGDGGIFATENGRGPDARGTSAVCQAAAPGVRWTALNHGYGVTQFYHGLPRPDALAYLGGTQDNGTVAGADASGSDGWRPILGGDGGYVAIDPTNAQIIYAETQWAAIRKSIDGGRSFQTATRGLAGRFSSVVRDESNFLFITPFVMDPSEPRRLWTGGREIYRTADGAGLWTPASDTLLDSGRVSALAVFPTDSDLVAAATDDGRVYLTRLGRTASSSTRWEWSRPREGWVTSVAFDPNDRDTLYATYGWFGGPHVYKSTDGGRTWQASAGTGAAALPDVPVHVVVVDGDRRGRVYVGTDVGVFVSDDGGVTWAVENTGYGAIVTESLSLVRDAIGQTWLFAFTHGRGAWKVAVR